MIRRTQVILRRPFEFFVVQQPVISAEEGGAALLVINTEIGGSSDCFQLSCGAMIVVNAALVLSMAVWGAAAVINAEARCSECHPCPRLVTNAGLQ